MKSGSMFLFNFAINLYFNIELFYARFRYTEDNSLVCKK